MDIEIVENNINNSRLLVVIPHFNDSERLSRALDSIKVYLINIIYKVVVVDDCSTEEHLKKVRKYENYYGIELIENNLNMGPSYCRNIGITWAKDNAYSYIIFIDSDDHLCDYIDASDYNKSEITIFNNFETKEGYNIYDQYKYHVTRKIDNSSGFISISDSVRQFTVKPNRVPILSTCWAKIFDMRSIVKYNNFFKIKMRTFEDVQFLISLLCHVDQINIVNKYIYVHTNGIPGISATFGGDHHINNMFSFLIVTRTIAKYYNLILPKERFNSRHFNACYYSISLIRAAFKANTANEIYLFYLFIQKRINSRIFKKAFNNYDVNAANGRIMIKILAQYKMAFVLTIYLIFISRKRYKNA
jgi:hypothetical protein